MAGYNNAFRAWESGRPPRGGGWDLLHLGTVLEQIPPVSDAEVAAAASFLRRHPAGVEVAEILGVAL